jgi:exopolysaccharide production protein ExoQ
VNTPASRYGALRPRAGAARAPARQAARRSQAGGAVLPGALVAFMFVFLAVPFGALFAPPRAFTTVVTTSTTANAGARFIKVGVLLIAIALIGPRLALVKRIVRHVNVFFVAFMILVPVSYYWSISRPDTLARYVSVITLVCICLAFCATGWHSQRFQSVMRPVITAVVAASAVYALTNPDLAIEHGGGTLKDAWHGLLTQKNPFGDLCSFGVIFWAHAALSKQVNMGKALLGVALTAWCLLMSRSSTSLLATLFASMFLFMLLRSSPAWRRYMPYIVSAFAILVGMYALAVMQLIPGSGVLLQPITLITGKDMTFSNRSVIWEIVKEHIALAPLLGSGYGAYWIGPVAGSPSAVFMGRMWFYPTESHNGYLEIVNDLGYVGLICLAGYLYTFVKQSLQLLRFDRAQGALFLALFFQQAFINLSESCWLAINAGFIFFVMTLATLSLARALLDQEQSARAAPPAKGRGPPQARRPSQGRRNQFAVQPRLLR